MDVVCTAGHVDHGKTALVRALTGMEPDRFDEERRRGLTIDIGFAWTQLGDAARRRTIAFVDLPGHERFIANMLAGAGPVEVALFVVAADEGWKAQSAEHLEILDVLGVATGVVALTKRDAVDSARAAQVRADVARRLSASTLRDAPTVEVSAHSGAGLDDLRDALLAAVTGRARPAGHHLPRLWVDRSFSIKGAGTVVTGTLTGASLHVGDDVTVVPGGITSRVRGLQSLQEPVSEAQPGDRVAVNLVGVERAAVARGQLLTLSRTAPATTIVVDVWMRATGDATIGGRGAWHLHAGSGRWNARIRPLGDPAAAEGGFARISLSSEAPLLPGDRFVLRDAGGRRTAGGGVVLDSQPLPVRGAHARRRRLLQLQRRHDALTASDRTRLFALHVRERGADDTATAAGAVGLPVSAAEDAARASKLLALGDGWADPAAAMTWTAAVTEALLAHHARHALERSAPRDVAVRAATAAGCPAPFAHGLVGVLARVGRIVVEGTGVRHPEHTVTLDAAGSQARDRLLAALEEEPFAPPRLSEAAAAADAPAALVRELEAAGVVVRLGPDLAMTARAIDRAAEQLRAFYAQTGPLTATQAKQAWRTSRKYAVPLLEELDRRGITRRNGDVRDVR